MTDQYNQPPLSIYENVYEQNKPISQVLSEIQKKPKKSHKQKLESQLSLLKKQSQLEMAPYEAVGSIDSGVMSGVEPLTHRESQGSIKKETDKKKDGQDLTDDEIANLLELADQGLKRAQDESKVTEELLKQKKVDIQVIQPTKENSRANSKEDLMKKKSEAEGFEDYYDSPREEEAKAVPPPLEVDNKMNKSNEDLKGVLSTKNPDPGKGMDIPAKKETTTQDKVNVAKKQDAFFKGQSKQKLK